MTRFIRICLSVTAVTALAACGGSEKPGDPAGPTPPPAPQPDMPAAPAAPPPPPPNPSDVFWRRLQALCGNAYSGALTVGTEESDREIGYAELVMHVRFCNDDEVRIPLHVDEDRSRTWILKRDGGTLSLEHVHRREDGSEENDSGYGGVASGEGTAERQIFPVDADTVTRLPTTEGNVWAIDIVPGKLFAYELQRERDMRFFRIEFDLGEIVDEPPPPWGADAL